jgi:hypothetical protein
LVDSCDGNVPRLFDITLASHMQSPGSMRGDAYRHGLLELMCSSRSTTGSVLDSTTMPPSRCNQPAP